jgi:O-antigen ligase
MIAFGAFVSLVYQFFVLDQPLAYRAFRIDRSGIGDYANYGWPVAAGIFHGAVAVWALGFALDKHIGRFAFFFWLLIFAVLSCYVLLTYTRGAWIGLAVSVFAVILIQNSRRGWILLALVGFSAVLTVVWFWQGLLFEITTRKLSGRGPIWEYFFSQMQGHWVLGHGLGTEFKYVWPDRDLISPHAHSLYFQQVYDSGLISIALLFAGLVTLLYKSWRLRSNLWVKAAAPSLLFALLAMMTDVERIFTRPGDYWTVFWLPVAVLLAVTSTVDGLQRNKKNQL